MTGKTETRETVLLERLWDWRDCGTGETVGLERL